MKSFTFTVDCHDGQWQTIIKAEDEPRAWMELARIFMLRDVRRITLLGTWMRD